MIPLSPLVYMRIGGALAIALALYLGYAKIKDIGYQEASQKYELQIEQYQEQLAKKIQAIELSSQTLVAESRDNNEQMTNNVNSIIKGLKGKNLVIVKNGECTPSKEFSDSFVTINKRVNENIK